MRRWMISCWIGLFLILINYPTLLADTKKSTWFNAERHFPISKVKAGMKGYGLSIFYGTKLERFEVEVLDVIKNFEPRRDAILVNLSGQDLERTGVIQGMSGSPVYFQDPDDGKYKIAGAVAFGWSFSRPGAAICGIQPIEEMLAVDPLAGKKIDDNAVAMNGKDDPFFPQALSLMAKAELNDFDRFVWAGVRGDKNHADRELKRPDTSKSMKLIPLSTPLGISGMSEETFTRFSQAVSPLNLSPIKTGSPSAGMDLGEAKIVEAGVLSVPLVMGDVSMAATGTVTDVIDGHVWGFGHSFFAQGPMKLPMGSGRIHAIIASLSSSFKLGSPGVPIGTLYSDENTAVAGLIGETPELSPLDVNVDFNGKIETYHYQMAMHERLTPMLSMVCVMNSITNHKILPEFHTVSYDGKIEFDGFKPIEFGNVTSDMGIGMLFSDIAEPINMMMNNPFKRVNFKKVTVNVSIKPKSVSLGLKQTKLDKQSYKPGEKAKITMLVSKVRSADFTKTIEFNVPDDLPDGSYSLSIGGLQTAMMSDRKSHPYIFKPNSIDELYQLIKHVMTFRSDRIYLSIDTKQAGIGIGQYGLDNLPETMLNKLGDADPAITLPFVSQRLVALPGEFVLMGSKRMELVISRKD